MTFKSGDVFKLLNNREYENDFFVVTRVRPVMGSIMLDAICEGAEDIEISVNAGEVTKTNDIS
jgi:hypothetical protein